MPALFATSVKLDSEIKERIHRLASARRRSPHWVMREAIEQYLEREEQRERLSAMRKPPGLTTRLPPFTSRAKKQMTGWLNSQVARTPSLPNATIEMVSTGLLDVARLHAFLAPKSRDAANRAVKAIRQGVKAIGKRPQIGRPVEELPLEFREWVIDFGHGACVALYHYDGKQVVILAVRHGREAGY